MDLETACHDLKELGVIDEKTLYNAIIEQGPKGEEGKLFKQQGIIYEEISHLRLEYLDILKIDHLWMMTGLTKLKLSNNAIEKIENLHYLINLKELDLSFNFIERIENLDALLKLEVLSLYQNKIETLENLENLSSLTVFSVGNNKIKELENILYLRKMESLKSFTMSGNPVCQNEHFLKFIIAHLPQLVYYDYKMISNLEKEEAREFFLRDLFKLERDEEELKYKELEKKEKEKQEAKNSEAFVEYLGGTQLFLNLFEKDSDCKTLLEMGDNVMDLYNEFKISFTEVTKELHNFGLQQLELRKTEIACFEKQMGDAKERAFKESRTIVGEYLEQKNELFSQIKEVLSKEVEDESTANEIAINVQLIHETFKDLSHRTWTNLMKKELNLFEATEEVNGTFERTLTELVNQFIEGAQAHFTQLRHLQANFNESLSDAANKFFTNFSVLSSKGSGTQLKHPDLAKIMQDKEILINALSTSHDYHVLVIDQREDKLVSGVKMWLGNLVENLITSEINRNRNSVMEINHFLDSHKNELQELLSTRMGLLLLPKEIQDALQIKIN